jgi:hypothetical protein
VARGRCGQDFAAGEAMPDTGVEVRSLGFGTQQFLKRLRETGKYW